MRSIILLCCCFAVSLGAQSPGSGGVFELLRTKPFVAEVSNVSTRPGGFKLALRAMDGGTRSFENESSGPTVERLFVTSLLPGRRYAFPQCLIDFLGLDETVRLIRSMPTSFAFLSSTPKPSSGLLDLGREHPFRATVLDQGLRADGYSMVLQGANSQLYLASGAFDKDNVKGIAEKLQRGETYEFPAALDDVLLGKAERAAKAQPKSPAVAVLSRYIGSWKGMVEGAATAKVLMNCHWLANGTGIWRELSFAHADSEDPPMLDIARITFDASSQSYASADPAAGSPATQTSHWDEATQTFTTTLPAAVNGQTRTNMATFTTEARIDWKTVTQDASGQVLETKRGSYVRTSKSVPAVKLPPAASKVIFTVNPPSGNRIFTSQSTSTAGSMVQNQTPASQTPPPVIHTDFFKLRDLPPFRGKITHIEIDAQSIAVTLERRDNRELAIHHVRRDADWDKALRIAKRLSLDSTHEFPAALADDYQPPTAGFVPLPTTDAMRELSPFIGEWSMHRAAGPASARDSKTTIHYFWSHDGTGLWREVHLPAGTGIPDTMQFSTKPHVVATFITCDPATRNYYEIDSWATTLEAKLDIEWDAETKTYSYTKIIKPTDPNLRHIPGAQYTSTRRIISPDHIDFHSKTTRNDGTVLAEVAGYYKRRVP